MIQQDTACPAGAMGLYSHQRYDNMDITIYTLPDGATPPWELLLDADPVRDKVEQFLIKGTCRVADIQGNIVGVCVTIPGRATDSLEIINIAVAEAYRRQGIASRLIEDAEQIARRKGYTSLEIGTGNCGLYQMMLYQKCGFRIVGVEPDFFVGRYDQEIMEHGIPCRDMVRLRKLLDPINPEIPLIKE